MRAPDRAAVGGRRRARRKTHGGSAAVRQCGAARRGAVGTVVVAVAVVEASADVDVVVVVVVVVWVWRLLVVLSSCERGRAASGARVPLRGRMTIK